MFVLFILHADLVDVPLPVTEAPFGGVSHVVRTRKSSFQHFCHTTTVLKFILWNHSFYARHESSPL